VAWQRRAIVRAEGWAWAAPYLVRYRGAASSCAAVQLAAAAAGQRRSGRGAAGDQNIHSCQQRCCGAGAGRYGAVRRPRAGGSPLGPGCAAGTPLSPDQRPYRGAKAPTWWNRRRSDRSFPHTWHPLCEGGLPGLRLLRSALELPGLLGEAPDCCMVRCAKEVCEKVRLLGVGGRDVCSGTIVEVWNGCLTMAVAPAHKHGLRPGPSITQHPVAEERDLFLRITCPSSASSMSQG
jgi:hypothetical protein